jgi:hypothetical protein
LDLSQFIISVRIIFRTQAATFQKSHDPAADNSLMLMCSNWVNSLGEYILGHAIRARASASVAAGTAGGLSLEQLIGQTCANYFNLTNIAGVCGVGSGRLRLEVDGTPGRVRTCDLRFRRCD